MPNDALQYTGKRLVPGDKQLNPMRVENLARVRFFTRFAAGDLYLDFGCGLGESTAYLNEVTGKQIIGVDLDIAALQAVSQAAGQLQSSDRCAFAAMDAQSMGFPAQTFDAIMSIEVIEHIPDPGRYLAEAARMLKPGGCFMLTTPNRLRSSPTPGSLWPEHLREYSPEELSALVGEHFRSIDLWGEMVPLYETHPLRRFVRLMAPVVKPILPHWLRIRALPMVFHSIKSDLAFDDVAFTQQNIHEMPTLIAVMHL